MKNNAGSSAIYGLGIIGAAIYFLQHVTSFTDGLIGAAKAIFWPAVIVFKALELLKA